eukprot:scaffold1717_cov117-Cylindrotheca_fusiformis.AAC.17
MSTIDSKFAEAASPPPKAIWDPDSGDEGEGTKDTVSLTSASDGASHPSPHMDAVQLRVQLWDSYRLARIILGVPVKTFNLKSKTILNAIRAVAEMKVELIHLNKRVQELEVSKAGENMEPSLAHHASEVEHVTPLPENLQRTFAELSQQVESLQLELVDAIGTAMRSIDEEMPEASDKAKRGLRELFKPVVEKAKCSSMQSREKLVILKDLLAKSHQEALEKDTDLRTLRRQFQTKQTLHHIEMESFKSKHLQQKMDLSGQLETYREQVERQHEEIVFWQDRYNELQNLAVTPDHACDVLHAINKITEESTLDEQMEVQGQVIGILQKMSQLYTKQANDEAELQATVDAAKRKEARSKEELKGLKLQEEILLEETKVTSQDWRDALAAQKEFCERQIKDIMSREETRLVEMEVLELKLTELAFAAVEIEDLQNEVTQKRVSHSAVVKKAAAHGESSASSIARIQKKVERLVSSQKETIDHLGASSPTGSKWKALLERKSTIDRLVQLESDLTQRNEELCTVKEALSKSHARAQLLEHKLHLAEARY